MTDVATQTSAHAHRPVHSPVPAEFRRAYHPHHHKPAGVRHDKMFRDLETEVAIKTAEIHALREESNGLEAKLLHNNEVLQIKEHELGVLEGRLFDQQDMATKNKESELHADFVASTSS